MVEQVEELRAELHVEAFRKPEVLHGRKIDVLKAKVAEQVSAHSAESADGRWQHHGVAHCVTAEQIQGIGAGARSATVQPQSFSGAGRITGSGKIRNSGSNGGLEV